MTLKPVLALSWKNVWRNPVRSGVVVTSVVLGIWAAVFTSAFMNGITQQLIQVQLANVVSHLQIHDARFLEERLPIYTIHGADSIVARLRRKPFAEAVAARTVVDGLMSSATGNFGVTVKGVQPEQEKAVSDLHTFLREGDYFESDTRNAVIIGTKLAQRLNIGLPARVVINFQDMEGHLTAGAFRVTGIFHSPDASVNENQVFVRAADLERLLLGENAIHEIAVITTDFRQADAYADTIRNEAAILASDGADSLRWTVQSWGDLSPALRYSDSATDTVLYVFMAIIVAALTFGIVNTMLMAVLERTQELGMLRAVGLSKGRTFSMIVLETLFLTLLGTPVGMLLAWLSISWFQRTGIDLGAFAQGFEMYGISTVIYPVSTPGYFVGVACIVAVAALVAAVFPSLRAVRLKPVEAIRNL